MKSRLSVSTKKMGRPTLRFNHLFIMKLNSIASLIHTMNSVLSQSKISMNGSCLRYCSLQSTPFEIRRILLIIEKEQASNLKLDETIFPAPLQDCSVPF